MNAHPHRLIDGADIERLLQDGPHTTTELAAWCETTTKAMTTRLQQLAAAGRVQRSNTNGRWSRTVAPAPPATADPAALLAQLEFAPKSEAALVELLAVPLAALRLTLAKLAGQGAIKPIGRLTALRWARADWTADQVQSSRPQKRSTPADPGARLAQGSTSGYLSDAAFTNLAAKPAVKPPVDANGDSWWTRFADPTLPRQQFTTAAEARNLEMCGKSAAWRKPLPVITIGWGRTDA
jgi:hypothetical protein